MTKSVNDAPADASVMGDNNLADGGLILISRIVAQGSGFLIFLVAVQFLSQAEFGLFAVASSTSILMLYIARTGWGQYIMAGRVETSHTGFILGLALSWGVIISAAGVCIGAAISHFMNNPTFGHVISLISLTIVPACYASVNESAMIRNGQVRQAAMIWIIAELAALAIAVITLFLGWKEYGLVAGRVTSAVFTVFGNLLFNKMKPTLRGVQGLFSDATKFYRDLLGTLLLGFAGANSGLYVVGFMFGEAAAGVYRAAARFSAALKEFIWEPSGILAWKNIPPSEAEIADGVDKKRVIGERYLDFMGIFALIVCPIMLGAAAVSNELTLLLLGRDWQDVGPLFFLLIISALFWLPFNIATVVLAALEESTTIFKLQSMHLVVFLISLFGLGWYSPLVAAAVHIPPVMLLAIIGFRASARLIERPFSELVNSVAAPFLCALIMLMVVYAFRSFLVQQEIHTLLVLSASIAAGAGIYIGLALIFCRALFFDAYTAIASNISNPFVTNQPETK